MMKRYDLMVFEEKDGTVHANMEEDVDGRYVAHQDAQSAIAAAVLAERKRVWDIVSARMRQSRWNADRLDTLNMLTNELFPDGEPTAEDSSVDEAAPNCLTCGHKMAIVRPGKHQCENDGCPDQS